MTRRYALYWLPNPGSRLEAFGRSVLGYDPVSGEAVAHPAGLGDLAAVNTGARVYGFHATLKAPLRLAPGATEADLVVAARGVAAAHPPVAVGPLRVAALGRFLALVPESPPPELACSRPNAWQSSMPSGPRSPRPSAPSAARSAWIRGAAPCSTAGAIRTCSRPSAST